MTDVETGAPARRSAARRLLNGVRRVPHLTPRELLATVHAACIMTVVEALIRWMSLPRLGRLLGVRLDFSPSDPGRRQYAISSLDAPSRRSVRAARSVSNAWPLSRGPCLRRALVMSRLLRSHDPAIRLGITRGTGEVRAHAWVEIDGRPLEDVTAFDTFQRPNLESTA